MKNFILEPHPLKSKVGPSVKTKFTFVSILYWADFNEILYTYRASY